MLNPIRIRRAACGALLPAAALFSASALAGIGQEIAELRQATAPFHNHTIAQAAGWDFELTDCMESAAGGMGYHYANEVSLFDGGAIDPASPEALMYEPRKNGSLRLVGVEYIILEDDLPGTAPAPELYGQQFHFNDVAGVWALHVWAWRNNSNGMFADWNPEVNCDFAD